MPPLQLPQARLDHVLLMPSRVAHGATTDRLVAKFFKVGERQGRYRILAAAGLGLISKARGKSTVVTPLGRTFMETRGSARDELARKIIAASPSGAALINLLAKGAITKAEAEVAFSEMDLTADSVSSLSWRVGCILSWGVEIGLAAKTGKTFSLSPIGRRYHNKPLRIPTKSKSKRALKSRLAMDSALRKSVELAAVKMAMQYYRDLGYSVESCEQDNKGWDLDVTIPMMVGEVHVEVKGTTRKQFVVELTNNEYGAMKASSIPYRICVVTDALGNPKLHEFVHDAASGDWIDSDSGDVLTIEIVTAAKLYL